MHDHAVGPPTIRADAATQLLAGLVRENERLQSELAMAKVALLCPPEPICDHDLSVLVTAVHATVDALEAVAPQFRRTDGCRARRSRLRAVR